MQTFLPIFDSVPILYKFSNNIVIYEREMTNYLHVDVFHYDFLVYDHTYYLLTIFYPLPKDIEPDWSFCGILRIGQVFAVYFRIGYFLLSPSSGSTGLTSNQLRHRINMVFVLPFVSNRALFLRSLIPLLNVNRFGYPPMSDGVIGHNCYTK